MKKKCDLWIYAVTCLLSGILMNFCLLGFEYRLYMDFTGKWFYTSTAVFFFSFFMFMGGLKDKDE